jgi:hypothetical protein
LAQAGEYPAWPDLTTLEAACGKDFWQLRSAIGTLLCRFN